MTQSKRAQAVNDLLSYDVHLPPFRQKIIWFP